VAFVLVLGRGQRLEERTHHHAPLEAQGSLGEPPPTPHPNPWPADTPLPPLDAPIPVAPPRNYARERAVWEADLATYRRAAAAAPTERLQRYALGEGARVLAHLGHVAFRQGRYTAAARHHRESLALKRDLLDALGIGLCLLNLGDALRAQNDEAAAGACYAEGLGVAEGLGDGWLYAEASERLGHDGRGLAAPTPWYGRLVDVGGHRLYAYSAGAGVLGSPTVVLEADLGTPWTSWTDGAGPGRCHPGIAAEVACLTRVVAYSRAGLMDSEPGPLPRTGRRIVADLHGLLVSLALPPPYVLVGHGFGCLTTALFAAAHPHEVAGLVLLDAPGCDAPGLNDPEHVPGLSDPEHVDRAATERQIQAAAALPAMPAVCVVPRWHGSSYRRAAGAALQPRDLTSARASALGRLGPTLRLVVAERSGHQIPSDEPDLVVDVIRDVVESARRHGAALGPRGRAATTARRTPQGVE
jgi:pimeloyl-ACP methyl ester carboxylesterase